MATLHNEKIIILDFGSQTTQLIARRIREQKMMRLFPMLRCLRWIFRY